MRRVSLIVVIVLIVGATALASSSTPHGWTPHRWTADDFFALSQEAQESFILGFILGGNALLAAFDAPEEDYIVVDPATMVSGLKEWYGENDRSTPLLQALDECCRL